MAASAAGDQRAVSVADAWLYWTGNHKWLGIGTVIVIERAGVVALPLKQRKGGLRGSAKGLRAGLHSPDSVVGEGRATEGRPVGAKLGAPDASGAPKQT